MEGVRSVAILHISRPVVELGSALKELYLINTDLGSEGLMKLLETGSRLEVLDVSLNPIQLTGLK